MKTIRTFALLLGMFVAAVAIGQTQDLRPLTKKEKKEWRKKKKAMSEEDFRVLVETSTALKANIASNEDQLNELQIQLSVKDVQIAELQAELKEAQEAYQNAQRELENVQTQAAMYPSINPNVPNSEDFTVGVVFKVQVGAFRKMDLDKYARTGEDFDQEDIEDLRKYIIGNFRNYEDANVLKRYLREMGVLDAWIVPYKDNRRVPLKEVIEGIVKGSN